MRYVKAFLITILFFISPMISFQSVGSEMITTPEATHVGNVTAVLNGIINDPATGLYNRVYFEYGTNLSYGINVIPIHVGTDLPLFFYVGGGVDKAISQYYTINMTLIGQSSDYGGHINDIIIDTEYAYVAGDTTNNIYQYWLTNLTKKTESLSYGGEIRVLDQDDTYVYAGGDTVFNVCQYWKSNMTKRANTTSYGSLIRDIFVDDTYLYVGGITQKIYQYWLTNLTKKANTTALGANIYTMTDDDTYIYSGGNAGKIRQFWKSNMTKKTEVLISVNVYINDIVNDDTYLYFVTRYIPSPSLSTAYQCWKSNLTLKQTTEHHGGTLWAIEQDLDHIYIGGAPEVVSQFYKSNLTLKQNLTSVGTTILSIAMPPFFYKDNDQFSFSVSGLYPDRLYHYRAVLMNEYGTNYGNDVEFRTILGGHGYLPGSWSLDPIMPLIILSVSLLSIGLAIGILFKYVLNKKEGI